MNRRAFLSMAAGLGLAACVSTPRRARRKPNLVVFLTDDQGYNDVGCFGSPRVATPNFDRMAAEGLKLTSFYSQPVCGPARAALMTGSYPIRIGEPGNINHSHTILHPNEVTIAEVLKQAGYHTALIGKWHCGDHEEALLPNAQGFDYWYGTPKFNGFTPLVEQHPFRARLMENGEVIDPSIEQPEMNQLTHDYTERAVRYLHEHREEPFFLFVSHNMPHVPLGTTDTFRGRSQGGPYGDTVEELDWSIGRVLDTILELGLAEDTLVVFTSDNGPWLKQDAEGYIGCADPLRSGKMSTWEGGPRVPCIMWWPGTISAGRVSDDLCTTMDLLPTFARLAGASLPRDRTLDGHDLTGFLSGRTASTPNRCFYYYAFTHLQAVRDRKWKLVLPRPAGGPEMGFWRSFTDPVEQPKLFNLASDPEEAQDVAAENPAIVRRLLWLLEDGRRRLGDLDLLGSEARFWDSGPAETTQEIFGRLNVEGGNYGQYIGAYPYGPTAKWAPEVGTYAHHE